MTSRAKLTFDNKLFDIHSNLEINKINKNLDANKIVLELKLESKSNSKIEIDDTIFSTFTQILEKSLNFVRNRFPDTSEIVHFVQIRLTFDGLKKDHIGENFSELHGLSADEQIFYINNSLFQVVD